MHTAFTRYRTLESQMMTMGKFFSEYFRRTMSPPAGDLNMSLLELKGMGAFTEVDGEYTMSQLSANARLPLPHMTRVITAFEKKGLVQRRRDTRDRRLVKVRLTAKGKKLFRDFMQARRADLENTLGKLSERDRRELLQAMEKAYRILLKINTSAEPQRTGAGRA